MGSLPLHPAIVHLPLGIAAIVPLLAIGIGFAIWKGILPRKAWTTIVVVQGLLFAAALFALRTGEAEEERVEHRISERAIEAHEELAEQFVWAAGLTLAVSTAGLVIPTTAAPSAFMAATALATVVTAGLGFRVGHAGGELVYGPRGLTATAADTPRQHHER